MEAGCGYGIILRRIAEKFPNSQFIGLELSKDAVKQGTERAQKEGLKNISFQKGDVSIKYPIK